MNSVTVYNTDSIKARDILTKVPEDDILTENMECVGRVYIEQCYFDAKRRFDRGLFDLELKIIGNVKELFIEEYDERTFPCGTKEIQFMDAEPVMINYQLTADEKGTLFSKGVDRPGFEPPANMRYNIMEIPMYIEYKGIYETPVCFARIIRPNEIQTSTKKCGYYGIFDLATDHPEVIMERQNNGIDINLSKTSPELRMEAPAKQIQEGRTIVADKVFREKYPDADAPKEDKSIAAMRETISERMSTKSGMQSASDTTIKIYHESVDEFVESTDVTDSVNVSDIGMNGEPLGRDNVLPYTVRQMDSGLYSVLTQKVEQHAENKDKNRLDDGSSDAEFTEENNTEIPKADVSESGSRGLSSDEKSMSKAERDAKEQQKRVRALDVALDNKALNEGNTNIAGHGASETKKTTAQGLLADIMGSDSKSPNSNQQFL